MPAAGGGFGDAPRVIIRDDGHRTYVHGALRRMPQRAPQDDDRRYHAPRYDADFVFDVSRRVVDAHRPGLIAAIHCCGGPLLFPLLAAYQITLTLILTEAYRDKKKAGIIPTGVCLYAWHAVRTGWCPQKGQPGRPPKPRAGDAGPPSSSRVKGQVPTTLPPFPNPHKKKPVQCQQGVGLEADVGSVVLHDLPHEALEGQLAYQQTG